MDDKWMSMKEICEYLGASHDTVRNWINKKDMPAVKLGGCWKFKTSQVDEWVAETSSRKNAPANKHRKDVSEEIGK